MCYCIDCITGKTSQRPVMHVIIPDQRCCNQNVTYIHDWAQISATRPTNDVIFLPTNASGTTRFFVGASAPRKSRWWNCVHSTRLRVHTTHRQPIYTLLWKSIVHGLRAHSCRCWCVCQKYMHWDAKSRLHPHVTHEMNKKTSTDIPIHGWI